MSEKRGPNFMQLVFHKISRDAIPPGGGLADGIRLFTEPGRFQQVAKEAFAWVDKAIAVMKTAPDNPYGDDDEAIAAAILERIEERLNTHD